MADNAPGSSSPEDLPSPLSVPEPGRLIHDKLERRSSKSRLLKQEVVEVAEEEPELFPEGVEPTSRVEGQFQSQSPRPNNPSNLQPLNVASTVLECKLESKQEPEEEEEDHSPNSDSSDQTVVPAESVTSSTATPHGSPKNDTPEDVATQDAQKNTDSDKNSPTQAVNPKVKLVRSQAVYDDASPPPEILIRSAVSVASPVRDVIGKDRISPIPHSSSAATLSVSPTFQMRGFGRQKPGQDSSQGSTVSDTSPALSRDSSFETSYTDSTGTNLEEFIIKTLNKKQSDRTMLLHLESDMIAFIKDTSQEKHKFPQMSSYHRMLVHRVAAFFGLDHNVDETGKSVIINRLECTRIPDFKFRDYIREDLPQDDPPKKFILKRHRDCASLEETRGSSRIAVYDRISKSFEERQEEYHEARNRIFQQRELLQEIEGRPAVNRPTNLCGSHQSSKDDVRWHPDLRPWSSTDSSGYSTDSSSRLKVYVTKASSFHSVTVLTRGDSRTSTGSSASRFSKTDSISSGISNLGSPIVIPPTIPSSPPLEDQTFESDGGNLSSAISPSQQKVIAVEEQSTGSPFLSFTDETGEPLAIWVASTIDQIPPGSIIINPQTGEPYINSDGSIYRWYPPSEWATAAEAEKTPRTEESPENLSISEAHAAEVHQEGDSCATFHHRFSSLSMRHDDSMPHVEIPSPSSTISSFQPLQMAYLVAPGNPTPSIDSGAPRASLQQHMYPLPPPLPPPPPPHTHKTPPFYAAAPVPSGQTPLRYVCQLPPTGYQTTVVEGQDTQGPSHAQYACLPPPYPSDVCQVMAFPQQMTIHSVETYPHQSADHGYLQQMVPCMYVPHFGSDRTDSSQKPSQAPPPTQQILYVPASSSSPAFYAVEGTGTPSNQGQVQVIRVNTATSPGSSGYIFYSGQPGTGAPVPSMTGGPSQYVCYTYPSESSHACSPSIPLMPSYPGVPVTPGVAPHVRPTGLHYPCAANQPRSSTSPKSPLQHVPSGASASQFKVYVGNQVMRPSRFHESGTEHGRGEVPGACMPRPQLPGPRLVPVRQPQVIYSSRPPASFPLGDSRFPTPNVPPVFQSIIRPRARVPVQDVSLCENVESQSAYQSATATNVRESRPRDDTTKGQQRLG